MHVDVCMFVRQQPKIESIRTRMTERGVRLQELKEQMNGVEDEVFRKFCREIGVANIRSVSLFCDLTFLCYELILICVTVYGTVS